MSSWPSALSPILALSNASPPPASLFVSNGPAGPCSQHAARFHSQRPCARRSFTKALYIGLDTALPCPVCREAVGAQEDCRKTGHQFEGSSSWNVYSLCGTNWWVALSLADNVLTIAFCQCPRKDSQARMEGDTLIIP